MTAATLDRPKTRSVSNIGQLAATARREHGLCLASRADMVKHAIAAGEALLLAQAQTPAGLWDEWIENNTAINPSSAWQYMRVARFKEIVGDAESLSSALRMLTEGGHKRKTGGRSIMEWHGSAHDLKKSGASHKEISLACGIHLTQIYRLFETPAQKEHRLSQQAKANVKRMRQRRALQRQERESLVRSGSISEAYVLIKRASQILEDVGSSGVSYRARRSLTAAITNLHKAEDFAASAVRLSHESVT